MEPQSAMLKDYRFTEELFLYYSQKVFERRTDESKQTAPLLKVPLQNNITSDVEFGILIHFKFE